MNHWADFLQTPAGIASVGLLGLFVGSFLNVVIYRLPLMIERDEKRWAWHVLYGQTNCHPDLSESRFNLVVPRSACPQCGKRIAAWENIPVLSWLFQRGSCTGCGGRISPRYLAVEILAALVSVLVVLYYPHPLQLAFALMFTWGLIALIFIDARHQILPDRITLSLLWLGIIAALCDSQFVGLASSVTGVLVGYLSLWSIYWLFKLLTGKEGMGHGDFKLLACLCAWQGAWTLPVILLAAAVCGLLYAWTIGLGWSKAMPFGPFLCTAGWLSFLYGDHIAVWLGFFPG